MSQITAFAELKALANRFDEAANRYKDFYPSLTIPVRLDEVSGSPSDRQLTPIGPAKFEIVPRDDGAVDEFCALARLALQRLSAVRSEAESKPTANPLTDWLKVVYEKVGALSCLEVVEPPVVEDEVVEPPAGEDDFPEPGEFNPEDPLVVGGWQERVTGETDAFRLSALAITQIVAGLESGNTASDQSQPKATKRERRAEWLAEAMLLVRDHPEWSDAEVARQVEIDKSQLSRSPEYQMASGQARGRKTDQPEGYITVDAGTRLHGVEGGSDDKVDRGLPIRGSRYFREYCAKCGEPMRVQQDQVASKPVCDDCRT